MKFFAIFAVIVAVTCAYQRQWTIHELSEAIQNPQTDPALVPHLEAALNELMLEAMTEQTSPVATPVLTPTMEISTWTLNELSEALQNPNTDPSLLPYLEDALNTIMATLMSGQQQESIVIATPVGLLPVGVIENPVPSPVVHPVSPVPVVIPTPADSVEATPSSPLVQIIVNINQQEAVAPVPVLVPTPVATEVEWVAPVRPEPVQTIVPGNPVDVVAISPPEAIINPVDVVAISPPEAIINPVDVVAISPPEAIINPVDVVAISPPEAIINPVDVVAISPPEAIINPVDVVAISPPEAIINPIDVIAITAPEVNPIDIASPIPVAPVGAAVVGPIL